MLVIAGLIIVVIILMVWLLHWTNNVPSACTGNCRQGRDCDCMEKKND